MSQRTGASASIESSALRLAQATAGFDASTWATRAPALAQARDAPPVYPNSDSTSGGRPSRSAVIVVARDSQDHVAACSGKTPTWPPAAGRHSRVIPATVTDQGSRAAPRTQAPFDQRRSGFAQ